MQNTGGRDASSVYQDVSAVRMVRGEGIYLFDELGSSFIDSSSATLNLSLGYGHPAVLEAMRDQAERLVHVSSSYQTEVSPSASTCPRHVRFSQTTSPHPSPTRDGGSPPWRRWRTRSHRG